MYICIYILKLFRGFKILKCVCMYLNQQITQNIFGILAFISMGDHAKITHNVNLYFNDMPVININQHKEQNNRDGRLLLLYCYYDLVAILVASVVS